jgi:putative ABC transport system substrate-binding protein
MQFDLLKRREFIALLGGMAAWPLAAHAQDAQRRVGVLMQYAESDREAQVRAMALEEELQRLGRTKGRDLRIDYRWVGLDSGRFQPHAADLVRLREEVIVAVSSPAVRALQRETQSIPIVFTQVSDPVGQGIVKTMARPGGNTTGFTNYDPEIGGKWLGLLKEAAPNLATVAVVFNPRTAPYAALYLRAIEAVAPSIAVKAVALPVHDDAELEAAFTKHAREQGSGLIVMTDVFTASHRKRIIELAAQLELPAIYPYRYYVVDGGMMSYGIDQVEQMRGAAGYVDRILKGEKVGDLPVQAPTKFQLTINLKAAKALRVPPTLLARADEVIEQ